MNKENKETSRREFLKKNVFWGAALMISGAFGRFFPLTKKSPGLSQKPGRYYKRLAG
ncbi:MAG: hypothetical protein JW893_02855 [Candidatus Omnitrophica bacterium]|nr:hypothetical protein [Candidatus Omnitrophota bacterium]